MRGMNHTHEPDVQAPCFLCNQLGYIWEEARETHPAGMKMQQAVSILINDRFERGILSQKERIQLHGQNNGCRCPNNEHIEDGAPCNPFMDWTEAEKREAWGK